MPGKAEMSRIEEQQLWWEGVKRDYPEFVTTRNPNNSLRFQINEMQDALGNSVRLVIRTAGTNTSLAVFLTHNMVVQFDTPSEIEANNFIKKVSPIISKFRGSNQDLWDTLHGEIEDAQHDWNYNEQQTIDITMVGDKIASVIYDPKTRQYFYQEVCGLITIVFPAQSLEEAKSFLHTLPKSQSTTK